MHFTPEKTQELTATTPTPKFAEFFDVMADGSRRMLDTLRHPDASNGGPNFPLGEQAQIIEDWLNPSWNHNPKTVGALTYHYLNEKNNTVVLANKVKNIYTFITRMNDLLVSYANEHDLCNQFESIGIAGLNSLKEEVMPWCGIDFVGRSETVNVTVSRCRTIVETLTFEMEKPRDGDDYSFNQEAEELAANAFDGDWEESDSCYNIDDYNVIDVDTL